MFGGLLGSKRGPDTQPLQHPTASGHLPDADDLQNVAPPAKMAEKGPPEQSVEEIVAALSSTVASLSGQLASVFPEVGRLTASLAKLTLDLDSQKALTKEVERENNALKTSKAIADERTGKLDKRVEQLEARCLRLEKGKGPAVASLEGTPVAELTRAQEDTAQTVTELRQQVEQQDRQQRSLNVMVFQLPEDGRQSPAQQVAACLHKVGLTVPIATAVRLGAPSRPLDTPPGFPSPAGSPRPRPRPVKITLTTREAVSAVFKATRRLRERCHISVDRDLTLQQRTLRSSKSPAMKELWNRGYQAYWQSEQLYFRDRATGQPTLFNGRNMPPSRA